MLGMPVQEWKVDPPFARVAEVLRVESTNPIVDPFAIHPGSVEIEIQITQERLDGFQDCFARFRLVFRKSSIRAISSWIVADPPAISPAVKVMSVNWNTAR